MEMRLKEQRDRERDR
jgi:hypothetical protein